MRRSPIQAIMFSSISENGRLMLTFRSATGRQSQQRGQAAENSCYQAACVFFFIYTD